MRLCTLGTLTLKVGDEEITDLAGRPQRAAVLVYLVCERVTTREKVLGVLWPDRPSNKGRHALNQTLHVLRRQLGTGWLEAHGDQLRVTDAMAVDIEAFEGAAEAERWEETVAMYRGPFLDGLYLANTNEFESWVSGLQRRLEDRHYEAYRRLLAARKNEDPSAALETARGWVRCYPHMGEAQYAYVTLLAASGRWTEALRQWEHYEGRVNEEGLLEPSGVWRELGERLRRGPSSDSSGPKIEGEDDAKEGTAPWRGTPLRGPRLVRMVDGKEAESYRLRTGETSLGREKCHLTFPEDGLLSRRHALFRVEERTHGAADTTGLQHLSHRCTVQDAGSSNGVFVRIRDDWPLQDGDTFATGQQLFRFRTSERDEGEAAHHVADS